MEALQALPLVRLPYAFGLPSTWSRENPQATAMVDYITGLLLRNSASIAGCSAPLLASASGVKGS